jgi:hypothetical protein
VISAVLVVAGSPAPASAATRTVALWYMNETSGTVMHDWSGHRNRGTLHHVTLGEPSRHGSAYGFNGHSSYVHVSDSPSLDPGSAPFSITVNLRFGRVPAKNHDYDVLRKGLSTTRGGDYKIEILHTGMALCLFKGSARALSFTHGPNLGDGRWHKVTCAKRDHSIRLVVDGTVYSRSGTVGTIANSYGVNIGAKPEEDYFQGRIDGAHIVLG